MKECPQCGRTFTEDNQFCLEDGTALLSADAMPTQSYSGDIPTVVVPKIPPTQYFEAPAQNQIPPQVQTPPQIITPQFQVSPSAPQIQTNSTGKWVFPLVGLLLAVILVLGFIIVFQLTKKDESVAGNANTANKETTKPSESPTTLPSKATPETTPATQISNSVPGKYPEGSTRYLTENDIAGKSNWELRIMRNEIFARHGRRFKSADLRNYFMSQPWYSPRFDEVQLNAIETRNVEFLRSYE